ncbi:MAG: SPASM domain-containing protein [Candidatus Omnitrophica bacterium]|nr:SPASM domain-containing protein [Candidatus Omnitrophota bacterium]
MDSKDLVETPQRIHGKRKDDLEKVLSKELGVRYEEYRKNWIAVSKREVVTDFPLYIQIEHTGRCNLRCPTCLQGIDSLREEYSSSFTPLDLDLYKKVLDEAKGYGCPSIAFHNNDEPLLLKDLENRIEMAKEAGFLDIIMTTNATLLTPERTHKLIGSGITKINFSVDAFNEEDYKQVRKGGDFTTVLANIEYFCEYKKKNRQELPITRVTCVASKFTAKKIEEFKKFWETRVDMVEFQNFQALKGHTEAIKPEGAKVDSSFTCNGPWQQVVIRANGDVAPCCSFYGTGIIVGNIKDSTIYEIWNGDRMKGIREELLKNNFSFSSACKQCSETFYTL